MHLTQGGRIIAQDRKRAAAQEAKAVQTENRRQEAELRLALERAIAGNTEVAHELAHPIWSAVAKRWAPSLRGSASLYDGTLRSFENLQHQVRALNWALVDWAKCLDLIPPDSIKLAEACVRLREAKQALAHNDFYLILGREGVDSAILSAMGDWPTERCVEEALKRLCSVEDISPNSVRNVLITQLTQAS